MLGLANAKKVFLIWLYFGENQTLLQLRISVSQALLEYANTTQISEATYPKDTIIMQELNCEQHMNKLIYFCP